MTTELHFHHPLDQTCTDWPGSCAGHAENLDPFGERISVVPNPPAPLAPAMMLTPQQAVSIGSLAATLPFAVELEEVTAEPGVVIAHFLTFGPFQEPSPSTYVIGPAGQIGYHSRAARNQLGLETPEDWR